MIFKKVVHSFLLAALFFYTQSDIYYTYLKVE